MIHSPNDSAESRTSSGPGPLVLGLFLASAVVLFGGILTGYALLRVNDPGAYSWAPTLLDRRCGLVIAVSSLVTCFSAAGALRLALAAKVVAARRLLLLALLAGVTVLVVRAIEFPSTSLRAGFLPKPKSAPSTKASVVPVAAATHVGDAAQGKRIYLGTCAACHAPDGSGVKGQGQNLKDSQFLKDKSDDKALAFVKVGRQPFDPESKLHLAMPARGGNPALNDASLLDAIAYVRELQKVAAVVAAAPPAASQDASPAAKATSPDQPQMIDGELWLPHSILPAAAAGPGGCAPETVSLQKPGAEGHSGSNVRRFFSFLLVVGGLHTIYVLFGLLLGLSLYVSTMPGRVPQVSIAMAAVYWVVIGAIGALLVPAFYV